MMNCQCYLKVVGKWLKTEMLYIKNLNLNDDAINKGFERIKTRVFRMNGLINSTLNLAKMENTPGPTLGSFPR